MTASDHVVTALFDGLLPAGRILAGDAHDEYTHDEALGATPVVPIAVLLPETASEVAAILRVCNEHRIAVTAAEAAPVWRAPRSRAPAVSSCRSSA